VEDPFDVVLPRDHRLAARRRFKLGDLADEAWITPSSCFECHDIVRRSCLDAGFDPKVAFETDENMAAQAFVATGVGVALMPRLALEPLHASVVVRSLGRDAPTRLVQAARLAEGYRSPASEAMVQILQDVAEDYREAELAVVG
jgi:DNA-binding transcriptional LysR family regulator